MLKNKLKDIQNLKDDRGIDIQKVGVKNVEIPLNISRKDDKSQIVSAKATISVFLPKDFKGTHMSRFIEKLNEWEQKNLLGDDIKVCLHELTKYLNATSADLRLEFKYFIEKISPVTKLKSFMGYNCTFEGELSNDKYLFKLGVEVPVSTVCPCSKEISEYGAHNQRSLIKVKVSYDEGTIVWIEDLIELIEQTGSCPIYPLLKREDEKYVTEYAYDNPKFVEDVLRDSIVNLKKLDNLTWFELDCESFESIHNHSAFAYHQESL